jgi:hypothetical protein
MLKRKRRLKLKKFFISFLLFVLVISSAGPAFLYPRPAQAQQIVTDLVGTATDVGQWIADVATSIYENVIKEAAAISFKNVVGSFLNQIAFDAAMAVANGGKGQGPLFIGDPSYWANLADSVTGDLLNEFAKGAFGIDLCTFGWDPKLQLSMMFAIENPCAQFNDTDDRKPAGSPPALCKAKCSISAIAKNAQKAKNINLKNAFEFKAGLGQQASSFRDNAESIRQSIGSDTNLFGTKIRDELITMQEAADSIGDNFYSKLGTDILGWATIGSDLPDVDAAREAGADAAAAIRKLNYDEEKSDFIDRVTLLKTSMDVVIKQAESLKTVCDQFTVSSVCFQVYYGNKVDPDLANARSSVNTYLNQILDYSKTIKADLEDIINKLKTDQLVSISDYVSLADSSRQLKPSGNDYGVFLEAQSTIAIASAKKKERKEFNQMIQGRLNDITSTISGYTRTPSTSIQNMLNDSFNKSGSAIGTYTASIIADSVGVFTSTLMNQLMQKALEGLVSALSPGAIQRDYSDLYVDFTPLAYTGQPGWGSSEGQMCNRNSDCQAGYICKNLGTPAGYCEKQTSCRQPGESCFIPSEANPASQGQQSRECCERLQCTKGQCVEIPTEEGGNVSAPDVLSDISGGVEESKKYLSTNLDLKQVEPTSYDLLTQFSLCSSSTQINRLSDNCVIDQGFVQAIRQQQSYGFMSIDDAISKDFLHKNWKIGQ